MANVVGDQPQIRLPFIGWIWPIGVESLRIDGNRLTVGLNGWEDYTMEIQ